MDRFVSLIQWLLCLALITLIFVHEIAYSLSSSLYTNSSSNSARRLLCSHQESSALLQFKRTFTISSDASLYCDYNQYHYEGILSYPKTEHWKVGSDCCSWDGITCDDVSGHVVELDLSCSQLQGVIRSNSSLFQLRHIQSLNLAQNNFTGSHMSSEFGKFADLTHLNLSSSRFVGVIPSEISNLSNLVSLDLSWNYELDGHIPNSLANLTKLTHLDLSIMGVSGHVSTTFFSNLDQLEFLDLSWNQLEGQIPSTFASLKKLQVLRLNSNGFTGSFPFANLSQLSHLSISNNYLTGHIPLETSGFRLIYEMDLSSNSFHGTIPSWLFTRLSLVSLRLQENQLNGEIPFNIGNLLNLSELILSSNFISGVIPPSLFTLPSLVNLQLNNNLFFGSIPSNIKGLQKLDHLDLSNNTLNGTIPSALLSLPLLTSFDLSNNKFTGEIGEFQSNKLLNIDLSNNDLQAVNSSSISNLASLASLNLASNNLTGTLELDVFLGLQQLQLIDLSYNSHLSLDSRNKVDSLLPNLTSFRMSNCHVSSFPLFLQKLVGLQELDLSNNSIHGPLPEWLGDTGKSSLTSLNLSHNFLTRTVEIFPWRYLIHIDLSFNLLEGALPVPPSAIEIYLISNNKISGKIQRWICDMSQLFIVDFSSNNLSGKIPDCLLNIYALNLQRNNFSGTIPQTFGYWLTKLYLSHNRLEGHIPRSLGNCTYLEVLDLGYNFISDTFPSWLKTMPELKILILRANRLHGSIANPAHDSGFTKLSIIDLSYNKFSGTLPSNYFRIWKSMMLTGDNSSTLNGANYSDSVTLSNKGRLMALQHYLNLFKAIDFSNNKFVGKIPESIGNLISLVALNLSSNSLTGVIPPSLGNLVQLGSLDLSNNKLNGRIPEQLNKLTFLGAFSVSNNNLEGSIPQSGQLSTFSYDEYKGNPGLCGIPLPKKCQEAPSQHSPISPSEQDRFLDGFSWKSVGIGYGCGAIIGIVIGNTIIRRNEEWFLYIFNIRLLWRIKIPNQARNE